MLSRIIGLIQSQDPEKLKNIFAFFQFGVGLVLLAMILRLAGAKGDSGFRLREADRLKKKQSPLEPAPPPKAHLLEGIRIDGQPHEILGVSSSASEDEIRRAYRQLMRRYHPDRVGPPGSREWVDAQKISEAINVAKDALLKKRGSRR